ncbi:MAG TPA: homoserine dehydrogenase, partial [Actinomycetes bacterium]|nr:homoserine dehydrogenase [Actinomycetes bacterium]
MTGPPLRVALLGAGVVGSEVVRLLVEQADDLRARVGAPLELVGVAVRRPDVDRQLPIAPTLVCYDAVEMLERTAPDVVVEVMGGLEPARSLILKSFKLGAGVVTANKALLAEDGAALYEASARSGVDLYYEASVAGAIPLLRPLRESLVGDRVLRVMGIVTGTTNYVLTRMDEAGVS